jgi:predicted transcriptional regulator
MERDLRVLVMSLRPEYAEAILAGRKTVELRRRRVAAAPGTLVLLYATRPAGAVVGFARIRKTINCESIEAWARHSAGMGIPKADFDAYLDGRDSACLLFLECVERIDPLTLERLRSRGTFTPPQSYRYLTATDPDDIHDLVRVA